MFGILARVVFSAVVTAIVCAAFSISAEPPSLRRPRSPLAGVKRIPIVIDEKQAGAEVSLARNFYFIFDGSGSMADPPGGACTGERRFAQKIDGAKWAVREFMKKVPDDIHLGLYVFDRNGWSERLPIGPGRRDAFVKALDGIRAGGNTPLAAAIRKAADALVQQYKRQLGYGEFRIVAVTDGIADGIPEAARYAAERGVPIYAIGLCVGQNHPLRQYSVSYRAADTFADLQQGLEETLSELPDVTPADFE